MICYDKHDTISMEARLLKCWSDVFRLGRCVVLRGHLGINALRETNVHVCCKCLTVFVSPACLQIQCSSLWPCGFKQTFLNDFCLQKWARWDVLATGRVLLYTYRFLVRSSLDWIVQLTMLSPENIWGPLGHMRSKKVFFFSRFFLTPST